ncbi:MAG: acetamidase/formamidase family protein [Desulfobacter sp.]|nr:acetamidase/formamidase family protein [Desulfobacter sp.]
MFISKQTHVFALDRKNKPAATTDLPARLTFETIDCFSEQVRSEKDTLDFDRVNPATGPVYFNGVNPGDVIGVHISDIRVKSPGVMLAAPDFGVLGDKVDQSRLKLLPIENHEVIFNDRVRLPVAPMIGVIGVAPEKEAVNCGTPGDHGGNMDTTLIKPGATVYFPVQVQGGLLAMGDLHAAMGDGEIMVSGVEVSGQVDVTVTRAYGLDITMPLVKTDEVFSFIASDEDVYQAIEKATAAMAAFLTQKAGLSLSEGGMLMSAAGDVEISQVVDPEKTARFSMPLAILRKLGVDTAF